MTEILHALATLALAATIDVPAGEPVAAAAARARPGDVLRLGPGVHQGALGRIADLRVEGAGAGATTLVAPEGEDGAVAVGAVAIAGLALRAGPSRTALKVLGGAVRLDGVVLAGGSTGAFVEDGRLEADGTDLRGGTYALLSSGGDVVLRGGSAKGGVAGIAVLGGTLDARRLDVVGPSREAGISITGGRVRLSTVTVRAPGPTGISISRGDLDGTDVAVSGATERDGFLGDCVLARRATVHLASSSLARCGSTALSASGGEVRLEGVDAEGGTAGCLVLLDGARGTLEGNACVGRGPALVAASGAHVTARGNTWRTDPTVWVDCGAGARVEMPDVPGPGPCASPR